MHSNRYFKGLFYALVIGSVCLLPGSAGAQDRPMRYRGLDRNHDGRITRDEWRGSDRSFSVHDRNGDGVLTGREVSDAMESEGYDDFSDLDRNHDGRISMSEWDGTQADFHRLDENRDGWLVHGEYLGVGVDGEIRNSGTYGGSYSGDPRDRFRQLDDNRDGRISRSEWDGTQNEFYRLDDNRDGYLGYTELTGAGVVPNDPGWGDSDYRREHFRDVDQNGNGRISRDEWRGDRRTFNALDENNNGWLSREEYLRLTPAERRAIFRRYDLNNNGSISRREWSGDRRSFDRLDVNNDGRLDREEFVMRFAVLEESFDEMDRNRDGDISRGEWRGDSRAFDNLDDNRDSRLSFEEFVGVR